MALDANALKNRASGALVGFTTGQRSVLVVAILTLAVGGFFFAKWASAPTMVPLFTNLEASDASEITSKLSSSNIQYKLADGGKTILVPQSKVYQSRLDMSAENLPSGGSEGYNLLDKQGITTSEFREHVDYQRALEGELSKTIAAIDGVEAAVVHLVIPKQDVFANDSRKPTASVLVKTAPGKGLAGQQVQAVVNLVASSIEGLDPQNVTVADDKGRVLASPGQNGMSTAASDAQHLATSNLEDNLSRKIMDILTPVVGAGKAVVQARAELNFDKSSTKTETWNPTNKPGVVSSERNTSESYANGNPNSTGVLGPEGVPLDQNANGTSDYTKTDSAQDYVNDHQYTETEKAPGSIDRVSVAVLLDSNIANVDVAEVEKLATEAAGLSTARGDTVTVSRMPFDESQAKAAAEELKAAEKTKKSEETMGLIKSGATFLIILVVLVVLFITTKRRAGSQYTSLPISMAELDSAMPSLSNAEMLGALDGAGALELDSPEAKERAKVDQEITNLIEKQPDEVASLLRSWLADRRS